MVDKKEQVMDALIVGNLRFLVLIIKFIAKLSKNPKLRMSKQINSFLVSKLEINAYPQTF